MFYEKLKQEIIDKISSDGFPAHLDLQDQGRFFVGYYHQRQDFFNKKEESQIKNLQENPPFIGDTPYAFVKIIKRDVLNKYAFHGAYFLFTLE